VRYHAVVVTITSYMSLTPLSAAAHCYGVLVFRLRLDRKPPPSIKYLPGLRVNLMRLQMLPGLV